MKINSGVHLEHPEGGNVFIPPGDVPTWAESMITNKAIILEAALPIPPKIEETKSDPKQDEDNGDETGDGDETKSKESDDDEDADVVPIPPKGGRGGSAEAWAKYAASKGFEVDGTAKASEIREALEAEGIPTE